MIYNPVPNPHICPKCWEEAIGIRVERSETEANSFITSRFCISCTKSMDLRSDEQKETSLVNFLKEYKK